MNPTFAPWLAAALGVALATVAASTLRFPLPFPGFTAIASGLCATLASLAVLWAMPARWLYGEDELIAHAFRERHGVSELGADNALRALQRTHAHAVSLRKLAQGFKPDLQEKAGDVAARLDAAARRIFYEPRALRDLQSVLARSTLIEDLVRDHATLRTRIESAGMGDTVAHAARERVSTALDALDGALRSVDVDTANRILTSIEIKSEVAETLLAPQTHAYEQKGNSETSP